MSDKTQVPDDLKCLLIAQKVQLWRNTIYDATLDAKIAKMLEDKRKVELAEKRIKDALKAIDLLESLWDEVNDGSK